MISIVCVYNNKDVLNKYLINSLKNQTRDYELILIDNTDNKFNSAAEALNYGSNKANGNYLMFVHQDVDLLVNTWLEDTENILNSLNNLGVAGVAGQSENNMYTNIKDGIPPKEIISIKIDEPKKVQTLDECLIIIPRLLFKEIQFDQSICNGWHLYAVDYCLTTKLLNKISYVIPISLHHASRGYSFSNEYYSTLKKVSKKHRHHIKKICTTCGTWETNSIFLQVLIFWDKFNKKYINPN